jgi:hypothetical protein
MGERLRCTLRKSQGLQNERMGWAAIVASEIERMKGLHFCTAAASLHSGLCPTFWARRLRQSVMMTASRQCISFCFAWPSQLPSIDIDATVPIRLSSALPCRHQAAGAPGGNKTFQFSFIQFFMKSKCLGGKCPAASLIQWTRNVCEFSRFPQ